MTDGQGHTEIQRDGNPIVSSAATTAAVSATASIGGHEARFADVGGINTRYYDVGQGEPLLLVHGGWPGMASANMWNLNLAGLGEQFRVLAPDRLACGLTDNPVSDDDLSMDASVEHLYRFLRAMGVERAHLVGQSTGAYLVARLALEHPGLAPTLVIVDSASIAPDVGDLAERRRQTYEKPPDDPREAAKFLEARLSFDTGHLTDDYIDALIHMSQLPKAKELQERWLAGGAERFRSSWDQGKQESLDWIRQGRLDMPTLLYWAMNDPTAVLAQGLSLLDLLAAANPRVRMHIVNHAGHFHFREYPEEFNRYVTVFLQYWG